jgi:hypothetical protein
MWPASSDNTYIPDKEGLTIDTEAVLDMPEEIISGELKEAIRQAQERYEGPRWIKFVPVSS